MKLKLRRILEDPKDPHYFLVADILAVVTIVSIISLLMETMPSLTAYQKWFVVIELCAVFIFTTEYLSRLYVAKKKRGYIFSFYGLIDLIAILPTVIGLGNFTFLKSVRALRIIRLLRILRLAKLGKVSSLDDNLGVYSFNILIYIVLLGIALLTSGTLLYVFEGGNETFLSIPAAMWWSLRVFLGSIEVVEPATAVGQVLYVFTRMVGLILFGVLIGVVGNIFRHLMQDRAS